MDNSVIVSLRDIVVEFDGQRILDGLNLDIHDKEFVTLLGPSGCGKTTTLRLIAGFLEPNAGQVLLKGQDITGVPPYKRPVNTVFQKYALFPHLNVFENVAFGLRLKKMDEETIRRKVRDMLEVVGLKGFERRSIGQMSGGQQQRVAIARSLVNEPEILLLDEPLGALDLKLRKEMQLELKRLQREMNITFIYVTHDQEEALTMSDTVVVMNGGKVQQIGTPEDIYNEPKNAFVADFIGDSNIVDGVMHRDFLVSFSGVQFPCVDRGIEGLYATLDSLDKVGLAHVGTARTPKERETPFIREIGGIRVGFVAYTYGTNAFAHHTFLQPGEEHAVNLFMPEETLEGSIHLLDEDTIPALTQAYYGQKSEVFDRCIAPHLRQMAGDVTRLRENGAQFIVFIMHSGGQYNPLPEAYTLELARRIRETGVDLIVGHHPHVIHPMPVEDGCPTAYSLGNFSYTPNFSPVGAGKRAEYSVVLRVDLEKQSEDKAAIAAMRFALCKSVFNRNGSTCVMTIPQLLAEAADEQERAALLRDNQFFVNKFRCAPEDAPVELQDWYEV